MSETCSSTFSSFEKSKGDSSSGKNKKQKCKRKHDTSTTTEQSESTTNSSSTSSSEQSTEQESTEEENSTIKSKKIAPDPTCGNQKEKKNESKKKKKEKLIKANNNRQLNITAPDDSNVMESISQQIMSKYKVKPRQDSMKRCSEWLNSQPKIPQCSQRQQRIEKCSNKKKKILKTKQKIKKKVEKWYERVNTPTATTVKSSTEDDSSSSCSETSDSDSTQEEKSKGDSESMKKNYKRSKRRKLLKKESSNSGKFILMDLYKKKMKDKLKKKSNKKNKKETKKPRPSAAVESKEKISEKRTCTRCKLLHYKSKLKKRKTSDRLYAKKHRSGKYISKTRRPESCGWAVIKAVNLIEAKGKEATPKLIHYVVTKKLNKPDLTKLNVYGILKWMLEKKILKTEKIEGKRIFKSRLVTKGANKKQMKAVRSLFQDIPIDL